MLRYVCSVFDEVLYFSYLHVLGFIAWHWHNIAAISVKHHFRNLNIKSAAQNPW